MKNLTSIEVRITATELAHMRYPDSIIQARLTAAGIPVLNSSNQVSSGVLHRRNLLKEDVIVYRWVPEVVSEP